jgi:uncharacterized small protein (DUF1192 family)
MRADNAHLVIAAAHRRSTATRKRAVAALRHMEKACIPVTFDAVAREAKVSRSWLYKQTDLRAEIERLRARRAGQDPSQFGRPVVPHRQRASDASLLRRLTAATDHIKRLEAENKQLRDALAIAIGERRSADVHGSARDTPNKKSLAILGPC